MQLRSQEAKKRNDEKVKEVEEARNKDSGNMINIEFIDLHHIEENSNSSRVTRVNTHQSSTSSTNYIWFISKTS